MEGGDSVGAVGIAIIGALAAILGGVLTASSNLLIEFFRRRHESARREAQDLRELRTATRLVLDELNEIKATIERSVRSLLTWKTSDRPLPAFAWAEHRHILAAHLTDEAWRWVAAAYHDADAANGNVIELERENNSQGPIAFLASDTEWLRAPYRSAHIAMERLEDLVGPQAGVYTYTGHRGLEELEEELWPDDTAPNGED